MFKRVSLTGSAELFRETANASELLAETDPEPQTAAIHHLPLPRELREPLGRDEREPMPRDTREPLPGELPARLPYYEYQLTEPQVRALIDAVQKLKYPHAVKTSAKLSMEEFERLEALRQLLLDGLR